MTYTSMESYPPSYLRKQLIQTPSPCLQKLNGCFFLKDDFRSDCPEKFWIEKVIADLLFLIKNITWNGFYSEGS